jgi:hypothetical protein
MRHAHRQVTALVRTDLEKPRREDRESARLISL